MAAVVSGKALLKYSGLILRRYSDSCIADYQHLPVSLLHIDRNTSLLCIFDCIGKYLFYYKNQPFFICKNDSLRRQIIESQPLPHKHTCILSDRLPDDTVQLIRLNDQIVSAVQSQILQHHIYILFYFK